LKPTVAAENTDSKSCLIGLDIGGTKLLVAARRVK